MRKYVILIFVLLVATTSYAIPVITVARDPRAVHYDSNDDVNVPQNIFLGGSNKELRLYEGVNYVGFEAPALSANQIWVLPSADGSANELLKTDGSGNLSWASAGAGDMLKSTYDSAEDGYVDGNDTAYAASWNGNINAPSMNVVYDQIETLGGDITSVGDAASGAALDGTSDGGTYIRLYDGDSHYLELNPGNLGANRTLATRDAAGTILISGDTLTGDVTATFDTDGSTATTIASNAVQLAELDVSDVSDDIAGDIAAGELTDNSVQDPDIDWGSGANQVDTDDVPEGSTNLYANTEEEVEDFVGGMLGGTETHITVTYQDATNDIDFVVSPSGVAGAIAEGQLADSIVVSADIKDGDIAEADLKVVDTASDEDVFTYESTTGDFEWHTIDELVGTISAGSLADDSVQANDIDTINCGTNCTWDATNDEVDVDDAFLTNNAIDTLEVSGDAELIIYSNTDTPTADANMLTLRTGTTATDKFVVDEDGEVVTGIWAATDVAVEHGGTGASTLTDGGILLGSGTGAITALGVATNGQIPIGDGTTDPVLATITGTANEIDVTNGAGTITLSLPNNAGTDITADLEEEVTEGSLADDTIIEADLKCTAGPTDNYILSYDSVSSGFTWVQDQTGGSTAWDDIGNPDAADEIDFGAYVIELNVADFQIGDGGGTNYVGFDGTPTVTFNGTADIDLPANSVDSADVNFNYAASASEGGSATSGDSATAFFSSGTIEHEYGGLEADISAYSGLIAVSGGSTSEVDAKSELETQIADVADFAEADGDTYTGTHDFGGVTNIEVHNVASGDLTLGTEGQLGLKSHEDAIAYHSGATGEISGEVLKSHLYMAAISVDPGSWYDSDTDLFIMEVHADMFPNGIIIDEWKCDFNLDPNVELDANLAYADSWTDAADPNIIDAIDTTNGSSSEDTDANINSGNAVAAGKVIYIDMDADPEGTGTQLHFLMIFHALEN